LTDHTPYEAWTGQKPNVAHLHEFRCDVWILDTGDRSKLDPKANKFTFVRFKDGPHAVRYYSPTTRRIQVSRDFTFEEHKEYDASLIKFGIGEPVETSVPSVKPAASEGESMKEDTHVPVQTPADTVAMMLKVAPEIPKSMQPPPAICSTQAQNEVNYCKLDNPRSTKQIVPAQQQRPVTSMETAQKEITAYMTAMFTGKASVHNVLESLNQAKNLPEWTHWEQAIQKELNQLKDCGTWEMSELPTGRNIIRSQWTFKKKFDADGKLNQYKA
jgi:hypothetical protein